MSNVTINISFQDKLLADVDRIAQRESRSRSELLREAARIYIERKERWEKIFSLSESLSTERQLTQKDVIGEVRKYRREKAK